MLIQHPNRQAKLAMSNDRFRLPRLFHSRSESNLRSKERLPAATKASSPLPPSPPPPSPSSWLQNNKDDGGEHLPIIGRKLTSSKSTTGPISLEGRRSGVNPIVSEHGRLQRENEIDLGSHETEEELEDPLPPVVISTQDNPIKYTNGQPTVNHRLSSSSPFRPSATSIKSPSVISLPATHLKKQTNQTQLYSPSSASSSSGSSVSLISKQSALTTESVGSSVALTPITAQHARTRSYIVGSVNHQVSPFLCQSNRHHQRFTQ